MAAPAFAERVMFVHNCLQVLMWLALLVWLPFLDFSEAYSTIKQKLNIAQLA